MEKLTKQEEEAMQAVWQCGSGSVKDFLDLLAGIDIGDAKGNIRVARGDAADRPRHHAHQ